MTVRETVCASVRTRMCALSQQHSLQPIGRDALVVVRVCVTLRVGAAGRGAFWGAQVVHERQPVLPTEIHKPDVAHARVEVHTCRGSDKHAFYLCLSESPKKINSIVISLSLDTLSTATVPRLMSHLHTWG